MSGKFGLVQGKVRDMSGNFALSGLYEPCQFQINFTELFLMIHSLKILQMVPLD